MQQHIRSNDVWFPGEFVTEGRDFGSPKVCVSIMLGVGFYYTITDVYSYGFR